MWFIPGGEISSFLYFDSRIGAGRTYKITGASARADSRSLEARFVPSVDYIQKWFRSVIEDLAIILSSGTLTLDVGIMPSSALFHQVG